MYSTCIDKPMQIVLERGSIDKPLTFNIGLIQHIFHVHQIPMHAKVFSIQIFQYFSQIIVRQGFVL